MDKIALQFLKNIEKSLKKEGFSLSSSLLLFFSFFLLSFLLFYLDRNSSKRASLTHVLKNLNDELSLFF